MEKDEKTLETEQIPSLTDKTWQKEKTLGSVKKIFEYWTTEGKKKVRADAMIPDVPSLDMIEKNCTTTDGKGFPTLDTNKQSREIIKLVYGLDGTSLQAIIDNHGSTVYHQMKAFAFEVSGIVMSKDDIETEKN